MRAIELLHLILWKTLKVSVSDFLADVVNRGPDPDPEIISSSPK